MWLSTILRWHWFFHMKLSSKGPICAGARAPPRLLPSQSHRGQGWRGGQSSHPCPFTSSEIHISGRKRYPSPPKWSPGIAKLADKTFLVTKFFFQNCTMLRSLFTKRMNKITHFAFPHSHWVHRFVF